MAKTEMTDNQEFALVHRRLDDNDVIHSRLIVLITEVPHGVEVAEVKNAVNVMRKSILDGTSFSSDHGHDVQVDWSKDYKLVPSPEWNAKLKADVALLKERALMTDMEDYGVRISEIASTGLYVLVDNEHNISDMLRLIPYSDLLDDLKGEKRVTLRLPLELHSLLASAAYSEVSSSLNSFCIKKLAEAVDYDESKLEEFEAQRRKPGRPKKVQDAE